MADKIISSLMILLTFCIYSFSSLASSPYEGCDQDGDGYDSSVGASLMGMPCGGTDCEDTDATIHPGASETCNFVDDDCDGTLDEDGVDGDMYYPDADTDGYGVTSGGVRSCTELVGYVSQGGDCDDANFSVSPGASEIWYDDTDQNCDGASDYDADTDGHNAEDWGGNDCDDAIASIYTGAFETCDDGVDQDCDGSDAVCPAEPVCGDGIADTGAGEVCDDGGAGTSCALDCSAVIISTPAGDSADTEDSTGLEPSSDAPADGATTIGADGNAGSDTGSVAESSGGGGCSLNPNNQSHPVTGFMFFFFVTAVLARQRKAFSI